MVAQQRMWPRARTVLPRRFFYPFCRPNRLLPSCAVSQSTRPGKNKSSQGVRQFFGNCRSASPYQGINQRLAFLTLTAIQQTTLPLPTMASSGTMRGTPKGRGTVPAFNNSPASNIPRPAFESHPSGSQSEAGGSTMSASRQKQSKRDEVYLTQLLSSVAGHN